MRAFGSWWRGCWSTSRSGESQPGRTFRARGDAVLLCAVVVMQPELQGHPELPRLPGVVEHRLLDEHCGVRPAGQRVVRQRPPQPSADPGLAGGAGCRAVLHNIIVVRPERAGPDPRLEVGLDENLQPDVVACGFVPADPVLIEPGLRSAAAGVDQALCIGIHRRTGTLDGQNPVAGGVIRSRGVRATSAARFGCCPLPPKPSGHVRSGCMDEDHEATWAWLVSDDGSKAPLRGTGLRMPLESGCWVAVDPHRHDAGLTAVSLAVRARREHFEQLPRLAIVPRAGNSASVLVGSQGTAPAPLEVVPVDDAELGGDIAGWLSRTTSGDPLGEIVLSRPGRATVSARRLLLDQDDAGHVEVGIRTSPEALLVLDVQAMPAKLAQAGVPFPCLDMAIRLHGSNLVSFLFRKGIATRVG